MHLPKMSFRSGLMAAILAAIVGLVVIPFLYDKFSEGSSLVRANVANSPEIAHLCGTPHTLIVVPWRLRVDDSDSEGEMSVSYWLRCRDSLARVDARLSHESGPWRLDSLSLSQRGIKVVTH